jgi:hypothetical protein
LEWCVLIHSPSFLLLSFHLASLSEFADCPELLANIGDNYNYWKAQLVEDER